VGDGTLDYSRGVRAALNENALNEAAGMCGAPAIDWDQSSPSNAPDDALELRQH
jgi:hypothetical protein